MKTISTDLPCVKDKCLVYVSCRNKRSISCELLFDHLKKKMFDRISILGYFPNLVLLETSGEKRYESAFKIVRSTIGGLMYVTHIRTRIR